MCYLERPKIGCITPQSRKPRIVFFDPARLRYVIGSRRGRPQCRRNTLTEPFDSKADYTKQLSGCDEAFEPKASPENGRENNLAQTGVGLGTETRRVSIIAALTQTLGAFLAPLSSKEADAFPSPNLETLQESVATSSRCGGETGISALRNPAIYRQAV